MEGLRPLRNVSQQTARPNPGKSVVVSNKEFSSPHGERPRRFTVAKQRICLLRGRVDKLLSESLNCVEAANLDLIGVMINCSTNTRACTVFGYLEFGSFVDSRSRKCMKAIFQNCSFCNLLLFHLTTCLLSSVRGFLIFLCFCEVKVDVHTLVDRKFHKILEDKMYLKRFSLSLSFVLFCFFQNFLSEKFWKNFTCYVQCKFERLLPTDHKY